MNANSAEPIRPNSAPDKVPVVETARRWTYMLDEAFRIPGTKFRFGWDPLIGFVPGLGELLTGLISLFIIIQALRLRVPHIIKARMLLNILIDVAVGAVPFLGDIFDFAWKSNSMNFALLEKHAGRRAKPGIADWIFVLCAVIAAVAILIIPILLLILLVNRVEKWIRAPLF
jgi:hypothetical protein